MSGCESFFVGQERVVCPNIYLNLYQAERISLIQFGKCVREHRKSHERTHSSLTTSIETNAFEEDLQFEKWIFINYYQIFQDNNSHVS